MESNQPISREEYEKALDIVRAYNQQQDAAVKQLRQQLGRETKALEESTLLLQRQARYQVKKETPLYRLVDAVTVYAIIKLKPELLTRYGAKEKIPVVVLSEFTFHELAMRRGIGNARMQSLKILTEQLGIGFAGG